MCKAAYEIHFLGREETHDMAHGVRDMHPSQGTWGEHRSSLSCITEGEPPSKTWIKVALQGTASEENKMLLTINSCSEGAALIRG